MSLKNTHLRSYAMVLLLVVVLLAACQQTPEQFEKEAVVETMTYPTVGSIERNDPALDDLVPPDALLEILAEGFDWSEGPVWVNEGGYVLFSDIPPNAIYKWKDGEGHSLYLQPSGYTAETPRSGEVGSNGLVLDAQGRLVLAQHGDRRIARLDAPLDAPTPTYEAVGSIERNDPALDDLVPPDALLEILAEGFDWSEGPVWVNEGGYVLFSDIPPNAIYKWKDGEGHSLYLQPSGYTAETPRSGEVGSNGLVLDAQGRLVLAQHGDRRIARLDAPLDAPTPTYATLTDRYDDKRFNSPNDLVYRSKGELYFTDPPYGLEQRMEDPAKEIDYQGVYRLGTDGTVTLLTDELSRPNGIAFSPDEQTLYVANSDPQRAIWMAYEVLPNGAITNGRVFFDATPLVEQGLPGLPDGLKVDQGGNLFATGPGGVLVFAPDGTHLGTINTTQATSNCAFGDDGSTLYITADMYLLRIHLSTKGDGF